MSPNQFYRALSKDDRAAYAKKLGSSPDYLRIHLFPKSGRPDRSPGLDFLVKIAEESKGQVSMGEVIDYFARRHHGRAA